jgi:hypothetical protein
MKSLFLSLSLSLVALTTSHAAPALDLKKGDHVCIIGNTLADRMQHDGWLETLIVAKYPQHDLVFRNLAVAGDEVATRHRSENFGSPDDWLTKTKADVILAFFGFNESFKGAAGLDKFKLDLDKFLKNTENERLFRQRSAAHCAFLPIANEKLNDPNQPDPTANNANLQLYTTAMAEVAKANDTTFVDLLSVSQRLYAQAAKEKNALTFNTLHLTEAGNKALAPEIFKLSSSRNCRRQPRKTPRRDQ